jgi:hypothetical protein
MAWDPLKESGLTPSAPGFFTYSVPPRKRVKLDFSVLPGTWWENALVVYSRETLEPLLERGNYARVLDDFISDNSANDNPLELLFTAWHKNSPPKASVAWGSSTRNKVATGDSLTIIGWHDNNDPTHPFAANITVRIIDLD